jgi:hypothetical protein
MTVRVGEEGERPVRRESEGRYLAYMLRLWQVKGEGGSSWRASLEDVRTGERRGFASLEELFTYLREGMGRAEGLAPAEGFEREGG